MNPSVPQLAIYTQFLANTHTSPGTTKNNLSGAKSWLQLHGGNIQAFLTSELALMTRSITDNSMHIPSPAAPLTPQDIKLICDYLDISPELPIAVKPA